MNSILFSVENVIKKLMRQTDLPGVCHGLPRTPDGARDALARYETNNDDLPAPARRLLALCAVARYFGRRNLEIALGMSLPNAPFRDWAWRWWNVLHLSGLDEHWNRFVQDVYKGGVRLAATRLRRVVSKRAYQTFLRRAGTNPHNGHRPVQGRFLWTKGGCWSAKSSFTTLLVRRQHLSKRPLVRVWQRRIGHKAVWLVERELMRLVDPDKLLVTEAKQLAVSYTQRRLQEILNWNKKIGPKVLVWFFQAPIPYSGKAVVPEGIGWYTRTNRNRGRVPNWEW